MGTDTLEKQRLDAIDAGAAKLTDREELQRRFRERHRATLHWNELATPGPKR